MPVDAHPFERRRIRVVQIQQDVAGVTVFSVGLKVYVTAFTIANAQESYRRRLAQLSSGPEPFARECGSGGVVNQPNQVEILRHGGELPSDGVQGEEQTTIEHKHNCWRSPKSPYNATHVVPTWVQKEVTCSEQQVSKFRIVSKKGAAQSLAGFFELPDNDSANRISGLHAICQVCRVFIGRRGLRRKKARPKTATALGPTGRRPRSWCPFLDSTWTPRASFRRRVNFGGPGEIRTHDLFHAMEARSQLRHRPFRGTHRHYSIGPRARAPGFV